MKRWTLLLAVLMALCVGQSARAEDPYCYHSGNVTFNCDMNSFTDYSSGGNVRVIADGWTVIVESGSAAIDRGEDSVVPPSQRIWSDGSGFTVTMLQQLSVTPGGIYTGGVAWAPFTPDSSNMNRQVGLDPTGGTNPGAATVQWGSQNWGYCRICDFQHSATATGGTMTIFVRVENPQSNGVEQLFIDGIWMRQTGSAPVATATAAPPTATPVPPTEPPTETPLPSPTREPTLTPLPSATRAATASPAASATRAASATALPATATRASSPTPAPTLTAAATRTPRPTATLRAPRTPRPTATPRATRTPRASATPRATVTVTAPAIAVGAPTEGPTRDIPSSATAPPDPAATGMLVQSQGSALNRTTVFTLSALAALGLTALAVILRRRPR